MEDLRERLYKTFSTEDDYFEVVAKSSCGEEDWYIEFSIDDAYEAVGVIASTEMCNGKDACGCTIYSSSGKSLWISKEEWDY